MRLYSRDHVYTDETMVITVPFVVSSGAVTPLPAPAPTPSPTPGTGSPSGWAQEDVRRAISLRLVPQNLQSNYQQNTTRAEFAALAVMLYEKEAGTITGRVQFNDTSDVNVQKAAFIGVVNGTGPGVFSPNSGLTRAQAATMLARLAEAVGRPLAKTGATFGDRGSVASWASEAVGQVQAAGIMGGTGNNNFSPKGQYTREQSIATALRLFDYVEKTPGTVPTPAPVTTPTAPTQPTQPQQPAVLPSGVVKAISDVNKSSSGATAQFRARVVSETRVNSGFGMDDDYGGVNVVLEIENVSGQQIRANIVAAIYVDGGSSGELIGFGESFTAGQKRQFTFGIADYEITPTLHLTMEYTSL
jgi:hypothetical protein